MSEQKALMRNFSLATVFLLFSQLALASAPKEPSGANCGLLAPPANAEIAQLHGITFITYPPSPLAKNYTGCQSIWLEEKTKMSVAYFESGAVTWAWAQEPKSEAYECFYKGARLLPKQSDARCPSAESWR